MLISTRCITTKLPYMGQGGWAQMFKKGGCWGGLGQNLAAPLLSAWVALGCCTLLKSTRHALLKATGELVTSFRIQQKKQYQAIGINGRLNWHIVEINRGIDTKLLISKAGNSNNNNLKGLVQHPSSRMAPMCLHNQSSPSKGCHSKPTMGVPRTELNHGPSRFYPARLNSGLIPSF